MTDYKTLRLIICLAIVCLLSTWTLDITILVFPIFFQWKIEKKKAALLLKESRQRRNKEL